MSVSMNVVLERGRLPDGVVPADRQSCGQNVVLYLGTLAAVAERLGLPPPRRLRPLSGRLLGRGPATGRVAAAGAAGGMGRRDPARRPPRHRPGVPGVRGG